MKAALIFGNPSLTSFDDFLAKEAEKALKDKGFEVKRYNVYDYPLLSQNPSQDGFSDQFKEISQEIANTDAWVVIAPMWNFSMPGGLKNFFDGIIQAKTYFKFTKFGIPIGLLNVKKLTLIWTSGSPGYAFLIPGMDHLVSLTKKIKGFCGIKKFQHMNISPIRYARPDQKNIDKWVKKIHKLKFI
jgi:FMN-dependent NADH-azoreductase